MRVGDLIFGFLCGALLLAPVSGAGQGPTRVIDASTRVAAYDTHLAMERASPYRKLPWQFLGPTNQSGRANAVAVADRGGHRRIYVGYSGSGLWKTDDNGVTWQAVFTRAASTAISAVAVAPSNPDIVWVLTGTARSHIPLEGVGVYKSTDAGRTWRHMGLADVGGESWGQTAGLGRIVIHPAKPDIVYVAAAGGPDRSRNIRGVFKTTDGGRMWTRVFYQNPDIGAADLVMDPGDPQALYVSTRLRSRGNEPPVSPAPDARPSLFRTTDGGSSWTEIATGLPEAGLRRAVAVDVSRSQPAVLYALVNQQPGAPIAEARPRVYRSDDRGKTWRKTGPRPVDRWTWGIRVDPADERIVYLLGPALSVSHDGGRTFSLVSQGVGHSDHNDLWFDPVHAGVVFDCNDGGFVIQEDGASFTSVPTPTAQLYNVELDNATPFHAYGSVQDWRSRRVAVDLSGGRDAIKALPFENAPGGEVTSHAIDPVNPNIVYASPTYNAVNLARVNMAPDAGPRGQYANIQPARGDASAPRASWLSSVLLSPHDPNTIYVGFQSLFRSRDRGGRWERISPDLSYGGPAEVRRPDVVSQAISTIAESPVVPDLIYAGTDDGRLHVTKDGGKTWTERTGGLPHKAFIWRVVASTASAGTVYVMQRGRDDGDFAAYLFRSTDFGETWTSIASNIPAGPVNVLREDPDNPRVLYAGTDFGVYVSINGGERWDVLGANLPAVPVTDLKVHSRDRIMVISTFGRGLWALDAQKIGPRQERSGS